MIALASYANGWSNGPGIGLGAALVAVPLSVGLGLRKTQRWGSLAAGLLIGLGVAALIEGICFIGALK
jgi:hypothetical protein